MKLLDCQYVLQTNGNICLKCIASLYRIYTQIVIQLFLSPTALTVCFRFCHIFIGFPYGIQHFLLKFLIRKPEKRNILPCFVISVTGHIQIQISFRGLFNCKAFHTEGLIKGNGSKSFQVIDFSFFLFQFRFIYSDIIFHIVISFSTLLFVTEPLSGMEDFWFPPALPHTPPGP